jgi:hypothetical protein
MRRKYLEDVEQGDNNGPAYEDNENVSDGKVTARALTIDCASKRELPMPQSPRQRVRIRCERSSGRTAKTQNNTCLH